MSLTYPPDSLQSESNMVSTRLGPQIVPRSISGIRAEEFLSQLVDALARHDRYGRVDFDAALSQQRVRLVVGVLRGSLAQAGEHYEGQIVLDILRRIDVHVEIGAGTGRAAHGLVMCSEEALRRAARRCWAGAWLPSETKSSELGCSGGTKRGSLESRVTPDCGTNPGALLRPRQSPIPAVSSALRFTTPRRATARTSRVRSLPSVSWSCVPTVITPRPPAPCCTFPPPAVRPRPHRRSHGWPAVRLC